MPKDPYLTILDLLDDGASVHDILMALGRACRDLSDREENAAASKRYDRASFSIYLYAAKKIITEAK